MPQRVGSSAHGSAARAFIVGAAALPINPQPPQSLLHLMAAAVRQALQDAGLALHQVTGLVASPSLAPGLSFMPAHQLATHLGLLPARQPAGTSSGDGQRQQARHFGGAAGAAGAFPRQGEVQEARLSAGEVATAAGPTGPGEATVRDVAALAVHRPAVAAAQMAGRRFTATSINTCGASPVSGLALARRMIQCDGHSVVVVAAADAVASMPRREFLALADVACQSPNPDHAVPSPVIPNAYDTVARWQMGRVQEGYGSGDGSGDGGGSRSGGGGGGGGGSGGGGSSGGCSSGGGCDGAGRLTRRQLAMCASLMSLQASRHPNALTKRPLFVEDVLASPAVAPCTTVLECAKRADGGGAVVVVSEAVWRTMCASRSAAQPQQQPQHPLQHPQQRPQQQRQPSQHLQQHSQECEHVVAVEVVGTGEASGPIFPPPIAEMEEGTFASCRQAVEAAAAEAGISMQQLPAMIDYWGLYDCFPICLVRAIEAVGLAARGQGGAYIERAYTQLLPHFSNAPSSSTAVYTFGDERPPGHCGGVTPSPGVPRPHSAGANEPRGHLQRSPSTSTLLQATTTITAAEPQPVLEPCSVFPINTHGGLLGQGAPWEAPAMYSLVEAVQQLRWQARGRQVQGARAALVYGNGGVFSASAVAILQRVAADRPSDQAVVSKL